MSAQNEKNNFNLSNYSEDERYNFEKRKTNNHFTKISLI